eukprot:2758296-Alexandrium_andersonii.AAC.1
MTSTSAGSEGTSASHIEEDSTGDVVCCTCKKTTKKNNTTLAVRGKAGEEDVYRCKACNSLRSRLNRVFKGDEALGVDWTELSSDERN